MTRKSRKANWYCESFRDAQVWVEPQQGHEQKRPSLQREDESLIIHRENPTAHHPQSPRARSSIALHGRFSHRNVRHERDAESIAGRSQSPGARMSRQRLLSRIGGGALSGKSVRWFLHSCLPKKGKARQRNALERSPVQIFVPPIILPSAAGLSRKFCEEACRFGFRRRR